MSDLAIQLTNVSKHFGPKVAVNKVNFQVQKGDVFGLIGPNGAGKTTTFSMMCGYLFPSEGSLQVMGVSPSTPGALKGRVGALPQDAVLPPGWEVGALLMYWARLSDLTQPEHEARGALEKVGLMEAWKVQTQALSHGMAKRAAMAQALMGRPPLVLLDEPTAGLDPRIAAQVRQVIKDMKGTQTVVVSSHNLQELEELCDAAAILDKGSLAQAGTMSELTGQGAEFRVQIARGDVIIPEITSLTGVTDARMEGPDVLRVRFDGQAHKAEEVISRTVGHLLQHQVLILGVSRGRRLEDRVLQLL
ncbi:ABC transporter ATP-binding protein [Corallococcus aberystwythensis]|uniref:ABC transporter ATP-binding protein n=1 Tax=Corallococcus aberystwythensis TaxID=2316722 RepID=A0A3A8PW86_9BACT|nr:ABC transporter ATP-binding protein [Corallococcus aberystwythensis]RKH56642.1 ABC transporter ATP-binding protein [Corallococcus aberystwythensis]